jgi:CheY-like chemotaxis protein
MPIHTVLVVHNDLADRCFAKSILQGEGYRALGAGSSLEALSIAVSHPGTIDALVADAELAGIGGAGLIEKFSHGFPATPAALLPKPLEAGALLQAVRELLPLKKQPGKCLVNATASQRSA